jgi:hypothetical protein
MEGRGPGRGPIIAQSVLPPADSPGKEDFTPIHSEYCSYYGYTGSLRVREVRLRITAAEACSRSSNNKPILNLLLEGTGIIIKN